MCRQVASYLLCISLVHAANGIGTGLYTRSTMEQSQLINACFDGVCAAMAQRQCLSHMSYRCSWCVIMIMVMFQAAAAGEGGHAGNVSSGSLGWASYIEIELDCQRTTCDVVQKGRSSMMENQGHASCRHTSPADLSHKMPNPAIQWYVHPKQVLTLTIHVLSSSLTRAGC